MRLGWMLLVLGLGSGCDVFSGLNDFRATDDAPTPTLVGNCQLDGDEACDDCNQVAGDGCDDAGQTEPGWYCSEVGAACWALAGFSAEGTGEVLEASGTGGGEFDELCATGSAIAGFRVELLDDNPIVAIAARCVPMSLDARGALQWDGAPVTGTLFGGNGAEVVDVDCPRDQLVVGFGGRDSNLVDQLEPYCASVAVAGDAFVTAPPAPSTAVGGFDEGDPIEPPLLCPDGALTRRIVGRHGARLDRLGLPCIRLVPVWCGDGVVEGPESCDDGNRVDGDGCSAACRQE